MQNRLLAKSAMLVTLLVCATSCAASTSDSPTVRELLQERASRAIEADLSPEEHIDLLAGIIIEYEYELEIAERKLQIYDKPWYEEMWDHDITKVLIFISGVFIGRDMVKVAN